MSQMPDLPTLKAMLRAQMSPWPEYMTGLSSFTIIISIVANGWIVLRGLSKAPIRESTFHLILITQCINNIIESGFSFSGLVDHMHVGLEESKAKKTLCIVGMITHMWLISVGLCTHGLLALNRALSCLPGLGISSMLTSRKVTAVILCVIWLVCLFPYIGLAVDHSASFNGAFICMILEDYLDNILGGKAVVRPMEPAMSDAADAVTSFVGIAIMTSVICYVIIIHGLSKLGTNQGDLGRTSMITVLLFAEFMAFWIPHIVGLFYDQDLLFGNHAYIYLPILGTAVTPFIYLLTMAEYRPSFCGGDTDNLQTSVTPLKEVE